MQEYIIEGVVRVDVRLRVTALNLAEAVALAKLRWDRTNGLDGVLDAKQRGESHFAVVNGHETDPHKLGVSVEDDQGSSRRLSTEELRRELHIRQGGGNPVEVPDCCYSPSGYESDLRRLDLMEPRPACTIPSQTPSVADEILDTSALGGASLFSGESTEDGGEDAA